MGRYSLNLRDKYGRNETTGGERIQQGIGDALEFWMQEDAARRNERNEVARQGGVAVGTPPTAMDRIRGIGGALRRTMRRTPDFNGDVTQTGALTGTSNARDGIQPSTPPDVLPPPAFMPPPVSSSLPGSSGFVAGRITPPRPVMTERLEDLRGEVDPAEMRLRLDDAIHRNGGYSDDSQDSGHGMATIPPRSMTSIATQPPPAVNGAPQPSSNIGAAIQKTIFEGRNGQRYEIDPSRPARMQASIEDEITQGRENRATARTRQQQEEAIRALTDAGMPAAEARARVLTNTVRYDQEFGQQRTGTGMTQADRVQIQNLITLRKREELAAAQKRAEIMADKNSTDEARKNASLALQMASEARAQAELRARSFDETADAAERGVPTDPVGRRIATAGGDSARIAGAESTAAANRDSAGRIRRAGAARAESIAGAGTAGVRDATGNMNTPRFSPEQTQARAIALKNAGKSKQEVYEIMKSEGYNVAPPRP